MSSDLSQQLAYQKDRAEKAEAELQNFKKQAKDLQEFLESESAKKQAEIRKLKQQSIMKEKNFKAQKAELTQLQTQITSLKQKVANAQKSNNASDPLLISKLQQQIASLQKENDQAKKQIDYLKEKVKQGEDYQGNMQKVFIGKEKSLNLQIQAIRNELKQAKQQNIILKEKIGSSLKAENTSKPKNQQPIERKNSKKQIKLSQPFIQKDKNDQKVKHLQQTIRKLEETLIKNQKNLKQAKHKVQKLTQENQNLQYKLSNTSNINVTTQSAYPSPFTIKSVINQEDNEPSWNKIHYSCLLLTKPHYISPFLQIYEDKNLIKIYKSTRSGCFEKSMGHYRHKFDVLGYEQQAIVEPIIKNIIEAEDITQHSIILYGVKKSNKKYLMSKIMVKLKDFLHQKLQENQEAEAIFLKRSQDQQKNYTEKATNKQTIFELIEKIIGLGHKNEKIKEKYSVSPRKGQSKPKIRYFNIRIGDFYLEMGSSSFTALTFRDKMTSSNMLSNVLYSKLPDILQSSISNKYLILTLNPIVDLYEECRNTLSTTLCKAPQSQEDERRQWKASPVREQLNDIAKKKIENIERQNEQTQLKIRKLQEDCGFYRTRFDELQFRLKNLLNTHAGQNSYLKKSPVTLSYEKLLKYVHSVQSRSTTSGSLSQITNSMLYKNSNIYVEKDNESVDAL